MKKPVLLIMAAGMGSRYGGLKQIDPVGPNGELILDYSLFDAMRAGFERAVIVIKKENEQDFREVLGDRVAKHFPISYAYQQLDAFLPEGFSIPEGRTKPWGTGNAVMSAAGLIDAPFCVINADDYYGAEAFRLCAQHLMNPEREKELCMVGYLLKNTLSETGKVARGVCQVDEKGCLTSIVERLHIISSCDGPLFTLDEETYTRLSPETVVSMNMWGFPASMMEDFRKGFPVFLETVIPGNPLKGEYLLPVVVENRLNQGSTARVYTTSDRWVGVTYRQDKPMVMETLRSHHEKGLYPAKLWD